jgi:hypothetical protein
MPVIDPLQALVHSQTQKKTILHGLSIPNPNFSEFAFFLANRSADKKLWISIFQAIDELV